LPVRGATARGVKYSKKSRTPSFEKKALKKSKESKNHYKLKKLKNLVHNFRSTLPLATAAASDVSVMSGIPDIST